MEKFTEQEATILNRIQKDIELTKDPLEDLAKELEIDRGVFLRSITNLKENRIIRDISAIFNAKNLGHKSGLIAFQVEEYNIEPAVNIINKNPGVSHNYLRDHKYNIWFTLTLEENLNYENEVSKLAEKCRANDFLILDNEKMLKIGLMLQIGDDHDGSPDQNHNNKAWDKPSIKITENEKKAIILLQTDLPLVARPFKYLIEQQNIDITESTLISIGNELKERGIMRRYSAVLKHQNAGYESNAMTAWMVSNNNENINTLKIFKKSPNISHLYLRKTYPGKWEYPLFAMIHARNENELKNIIEDLEQESGIDDYLVLKTLKEFKKQRIKYFTK